MGKGVILAMPLGGDRHVTVLFLGKADAAGQLSAAELHQKLQPLDGPQHAVATTTALFGPDGSKWAFVHLLDAPGLVAAHDAGVKLLGNRVNQVHGVYNPHVTLGYYDRADAPEVGGEVSATYDAPGLELWYGGKHYPLRDPFPTATVAQFYNDQHDADGRFTGPGAGAHADIRQTFARAAQKYIQARDAGRVPIISPEHRAFANHAFAGELPGHAYSAVTQIEMIPSSRGARMIVRGEIYNASHIEIGRFKRALEEDGTVHHDLLTIDTPRIGIGHAFNARAEEAYRAAGFHTIELQAGLETGGYAWAAAGYAFSHHNGAGVFRTALQGIAGILHTRMEGTRDPVSHSTTILSSIFSTQSQAKVKQDTKTQDEAAHLFLKHNITPADVAALGKDRPWTDSDGHKTWAGKEIMMGSMWNGSKDIRHAPITASAGIEAFYNKNHGADGRFSGIGATRASTARFIIAVSAAHGARKGAVTAGDMLSPPDAQYLRSSKKFLLAGGKAGFVVSKEGDLQQVFNNSDVRGIGAGMVRHAIAHGAKTLDCFDGFLPGYYARFGFVESHREANWIPGGPDVVYMALKESHPLSASSHMLSGVTVPSGETSSATTSSSSGLVASLSVPSGRFLSMDSAYTAPGVEQFYSASEARDQAGRWTESGGGGASPGTPEIDRGFASKIRSVSVKDARAFGKAAYEGPLAGGKFHSHVTYVQEAQFDGRPSVKIHGSISTSKNPDDDNAVVGTWERELRMGGEVHHTNLKIEENSQGFGAAHDFNQRAEAAYREAGFKRITLEAGLTVGGYAWAAAGYGWKGKVPPENIRVLVNRMKSDKPWKPAEFEGPLGAQYAHSNIHDKPENAYRLQEDPAAIRAAFKSINAKSTPADVAAVGKDQPWTDAAGKKTWLGKELLLGTGWDGVKEL